MKITLLSCSILFTASLLAQKPVPAAKEPVATLAAERTNGLKIKKESEARSIVDDLEFRNIGPSIMSGRVVDIDVNPTDPTHFYVAYASGGVWFTNNNGTSFDPVFDGMHEINIGDIAVDWNAKPNPTIWVGTGECNSSRSSYAGTGIYKSVDGGKFWEFKGLPESHHIGQILIDKNNPNTVYCAVIGHLFTFNRDRGLYKTTDGGATWKQTLFIDESTGVIDVVQDPNDSKIIYAIAWHRERKIYDFVEGGKKSGIYKSTNGGETFTLLTTEASGFPVNDNIGRIALAIFPGNSNVMYTIVDNQGQKEVKKKDEGLTPNNFRKISKEDFLILIDGELQKYLDDYNFPKKHTAASVKSDVSSGKYLPVALADFVEDGNANLFNRPIFGAQVWASTDGGATWKLNSDEKIGSLFYSYGYYFGKIWISPFDKDEIYIAGVGLLQSKDAGKTFKSIDGDNQHGDHHAMWVSPTRRGHLINGNDGGLNISWDNGDHWIKCNTPSVGQFYGIAVDNATPYNVYGGLQDNGVWFGPNNYRASTSWHGSGQYPWKFILGGDGMQVQVDTRDNKTVYTGYQFGHYYRLNTETGEEHYVRPEMELGDKPLRFSWQTPIWLSNHNMDVLYMGAQRLFRSMDQGNTFTPISGDLTRGGRVGDVPYGCLSTINESSIKFGLIYVGSDDGLIHVTKDGGVTWTRISDNLPQHMRVSRVVASSHVEGRVYATISGCQWDHFKPYVYVSENFGATWKQIFTDLPCESVNVVREDPENENLLFAGTDNGLYCSVNRGTTSMRMSNGIPAVAVHDIVIQARDHELVVGTHGRSIYTVKIKALEDLPNTAGLDFYAYDPGTVKILSGYEIDENGDYQQYNKATVPLTWYAREAGTVEISVTSSEGDFTIMHRIDSCKKGVNVFPVVITVDSAYVDEYQNWAQPKLKGDQKLQDYSNGSKLPLPGNYTIGFVYKPYTDGSSAATAAKEVVLIKGESRSPQVPGERD
jgi:photosystem II stability/assembly factor-like uncharacterized protein